MMARALGGLLLALALLGAGYGWGDHAATNRIAAASLAAERTKAISVAINNAHVHQLEQDSAGGLVANSMIYQKGLSDGLATKKDVVDRVRSGALSLSIPTSSAAAGAAEGNAAAGACRCNGEARAKLSDQAAEFLTSLASEADDVVRQLSACQADLAQDRATINQDSQGK